MFILLREVHFPCYGQIGHSNGFTHVKFLKEMCKKFKLTLIVGIIRVICCDNFVFRQDFIPYMQDVSHDVSFVYF